MSEELKAHRPGDYIPIEKAAALLDGYERVTVSGGEPMLQVRGLSLLLKKLRDKGTKEILLYTGFTYEEILIMAETSVDTQKILQNVSVLVDGPYIASLNDGKALRGSSNQHIVFLNADSSIREEYNNFARQHRKLDVRMTDQGEILLIGMLNSQEEGCR